MHDGRADLALDVVADDRQACVAEFLGPFGVRSEEDGYAIDHRDARFEAGLRIMLDGLVGPYRQIAQQHLSARLAQSLGDISGLKVGRSKGDVVVVVRHVRRYAIELGTHLDDDVRHGQRALEDPRVVRLGENRLFQRPADLAAIDIERGDELDVAGAVAADRLAHHAVQRRIAAAAVIFHALHQRAGAISDTGDGDFDVPRHAYEDSPQSADRWSMPRTEPRTVQPVPLSIHVSEDLSTGRSDQQAYMTVL